MRHRDDRPDPMDTALRTVVSAICTQTRDRPWDTPALLIGVHVAPAAEWPGIEQIQESLGIRPDVDSFGHTWTADEAVELDGHPFSALMGRSVNPDAVGAVLITEGWMRSAADGALGRDLGAHAVDGRTEVRNVVGMLRDGTVAHAVQVRDGGDHVLESSLAGRVPAAMRRTLGLPSGIDPGEPGDVADRIWCWGVMLVTNVVHQTDTTSSVKLADLTGGALGDALSEAAADLSLIEPATPEALMWMLERGGEDWAALRSSAVAGRAPKRLIAELLELDAAAGQVGWDADWDLDVIGWADDDLFGHLFDAAAPDWDLIGESLEELRAAGLFSIDVAELARRARNRRTG